MKAAVYQGPSSVGVVDLPVPEPAAGEALIKVSYCGICGSDIHLFHGKHLRATPGIVMGHELSGEIVAFGSDEQGGFEKGARVVLEPLIACGKCLPCLRGQYNVCRSHGLFGIDVHGGFAEYMTAPLNRLHRIPDGLAMDAASLAEPLAVAVHAVRRSAIKVGDFVAVLGAGPVGLLVAQSAAAAGAGKVAISEVSDYRLQIARDLGLIALDSKVVNPVEEVQKMTGGYGANITFDAAGISITAKQATQVTAIGGQIVVVAVYGEPPQFDLRRINNAELSVIGTREYTFDDFPVVLDLLNKKDVDASKIITHHLPLDRIEEGLHEMEKSANALKIVVNP